MCSERLSDSGLDREGPPQSHPELVEPDPPAHRRHRLVRRMRLGYGRSPASQQALLRMSTSFAVIVASSRAFNHARERHRSSPVLRGSGRLVKQAFTSNQTRIHHYVAGIGIAYAAGAVAILAADEHQNPWLAPLFGLGVGLTTDELRVMTGRSNPYWGGQHFAVAQAATAGATSVGLAAVFAKRGR